MGPQPPLLIFMAITLVVVSIVLLIGLEMASVFAEGINESEFEQAANNTTTLCSSTTGGCGPSYDPLIQLPTLAAIAFVIVTTVTLMGNSGESTESGSSRQEPITVIQQKYVDGEIATEEQLERELEWYIYPEQKHGESKTGDSE